MLYAIKPNGIGQYPSARRIKPEWSLTPGETFTINEADYDPSYVLAEDEQSLREPTQAELNKMAVPAQVTALQARRALQAAGLRSDVDAWVANQLQDVQDHWTYAAVIKRDSQFLADAATSLGLTEQQMDDLFVQAAQL